MEGTVRAHLRRHEILVLGVLVDVLDHVPAQRANECSAGADVVEGGLNEFGAETSAAARANDLGVGQDDDIVVDVVVSDAEYLPFGVDELVAMSVVVVAHVAGLGHT
jgi:hypothetical protein